MKIIFYKKKKIEGGKFEITYLYLHNTFKSSKLN